MMNSDGTFKEDIQCIVSQKNGTGAIFISNLEAACNPLTLKKHGIGAVITAIKGKNLSQKIPKHVEYLYIPVVDHQSCNISVFFKDTFEFIEEERKRTNVLVHCMAGVSRSVSLVIAYIMQKSGAPFQTAFNYVKSKRPIIHPNEAFVQQLVEHQKQLKTKNDENKFQKVQCKTVNGFGRNLQTDNFDRKASDEDKLQNTRESWSKGSQFGTIQHAKTESEWFKKTKHHGEYGQKQNNSQALNLYDLKLKQNIKKLFSQSNSRVTQFNRSQVMR